MTKPQSMLHSCSQFKNALQARQLSQVISLANCHGQHSTKLVRHCSNASSMFLDASLGAHAVQSTSPSPNDENSRTLQNPAYRPTTLLVRCSMSGRCTNPVHSCSLSHFRRQSRSDAIQSLPPGPPMVSLSGIASLTYSSSQLTHGCVSPTNCLTHRAITVRSHLQRSSSLPCSTALQPSLIGPPLPAVARYQACVDFSPSSLTSLQLHVWPADK